MKIVLQEIIYNFKQSFISNIILVFQLAICFWLICMLCNSFYDMGFKRYYKDYVKNDEIYYQMAFFKAPLILTDLNSNTQSLKRSKSFISDLRNQSEFVYTKYTGVQNIYILNDELNKKNLTKQELQFFLANNSGDPNNTALLSRQMDKNGFDHFKFKMYSGRKFLENDYLLTSPSDQLPIILGYNYKDIFNVGDKIKYIYSGKQFEGEIIGILEQGSNIFNDNTNVINLDNEIIIPLPDFEYIPTSPEEQYFQSLIYMELLNGSNIITSINSNNIDITRNIYDLCSSYDFMKFDPSITATTNGLNMFKGESEQTLKILFIMLVVMSMFCIFTFVMNMFSKIEKNMRRYLIQILQGASMNHILLTYIGEILIVILLALFISIYLLRTELAISYVFLLLLLALSSITTIATSLIIKRRLKNLDSDKLLRRY